MDNSIFTAALQVGPALLDWLNNAWATAINAPADWVFFAFIYDFIRHEIKVLGLNLMARASYFAALVALALVTIWVFYQGLRIFAGKGESLMALVLNASRVAFIVTAATSMGIGGSALYDTVGVRLPAVITGYVTNGTSTVEDQIDDTLFGMTLALKSIDVLNVATDETIEDDKNRAMYMAVIGTAGPAVTAGAMLLFYQAALALFIGLGPIFILCLMFDQTKSLFQRWLMYGLGTMFSMAILAAMASIALKVVLAVAAAHWATAIGGAIFNINLSSGITGAALQQGGIGLLLTLLLISVPPMAAQFFQGTIGQLSTASQVSGGVMSANQQQNRNTNNAANQQSAQTNQNNSAVNNVSGSPNQQQQVGANVGSAGVTGGNRPNPVVDQSAGRMGAASQTTNTTPVNPTASSGVRTDPQSGRQIDPNTGHHIDPATGRRYDPVSGRPIG
jgi:type IV secretion system protein VirB6